MSNQRERVLDQKDDVTSRISDTVRIIGFGLLIVYFSIILDDSEGAKAIRAEYPFAFYCVGLFGVLTVALDYLQYLFGYWSAKAALTNQNEYDSTWISYRARNWCFRLKQVTAGLGALFLIFIIAFPTAWIGAFCEVFSPSA